jgi:hypothetical protein|tara:strand:- start:9546 stop:9764 length:219 start_codon:yes stop_codon:yes gene_type:complete
MRIFEKPNLSNDWKCLICNKADVKPISLIGKNGTQEGNIISAEQIHVDCIELLLYDKGNGEKCIAQLIGDHK